MFATNGEFQSIGGKPGWHHLAGRSSASETRTKINSVCLTSWIVYLDLAGLKCLDEVYWWPEIFRLLDQGGVKCLDVCGRYLRRHKAGRGSANCSGGGQAH